MFSSLDLPTWQTILCIIGGLGLFLFGINLMGDSLKAFAGNKLKYIIEKTTNTPLKGILVGIVITTLIQSSSGTTAIVVGLVSAGLMTFPQAIGVIMGSNIGSVTTSFLTAIGIGDFAFVFVFIGTVLMFFCKKKKYKELGNALIGFGILFVGLDLMGGAINSIFKTYESQTRRLFTTMGKFPILGLFVGTGITAAIQSSAATVKIVQSLYAGGALSLKGALPIMIGSNIGTTATALIAAVGTTAEAKRTAVVHTLFNVIGAVLFMSILRVAYLPLMRTIEKSWHVNKELTISLSHLFFNLVSTFILFFFIKQMAFVATKIVPSKGSSTATIETSLKDRTLVKKSPTLALEVAKKAIDYMGKMTIEYFELARDYSFAFNDEASEKAKSYERTINSLDKNIHDYLIELTGHELTESDSNYLSKYLDTIKDLERIGDHCSNIVEYFDERYEDNIVLSPDGSKDLETMYTTLDEMVHLSIEAIMTGNKEIAKTVTIDEDNVDAMEEKFRLAHIARVNSGKCDYSNSDHFIDMLTNMERIGDHTMNIAMNVINDVYCESDEFNH